MSLSHRAAEAGIPAPAREALQVLGAVLLVKLLLLALDPNLRFFMGDSGSYLHAALTDWVPPDRSFTYPWLVRLALWAQSAHSLVLLQTLLGAASCLMLFQLLRRGVALPFAWAAGGALLLAVEPSQLFYERMMMAEAAGGFLLIACLVATVAYVRSAQLRWLPLMVLCGLGAVSMRMSLLPVVLGLSACAPVLCALHNHARLDRGRPLLAVLRTGVHLAVVMLLTGLSHSAYKQTYGDLTGAEPDYIGAQGQMRLGLVAPLVRPEHLARAGVDLALLDELGPPLQDPRAREAQIWSPDGLFGRLQARMPVEDAQRVARKISVRALQSDPLGLLRLGAATFADYFDDEVALARMSSDLGDAPPNADMLAVIEERLRYRSDGLFERPGLAAGLFEHSRWWLTLQLFLLAPLAIWALWRARSEPQRRAALLVVGTLALGLVASQLLFAHIVSFRYLHPLPPLFIALAIALLALRGRARAPAAASQRGSA